MDVQTESTDPPPNEAQPSGKIRKGFKLFGKRKPGNIFSIRSKGDGNNKSPVLRSQTSDGLSETPAPDSEQDPDKEKRQEVSQGETEETEDETLRDEAILAAAPARTSISSVSSAKSLGFLSLLRGSRRGVGDRRVHTVSQPVARQRRGLKGLFGNVKTRLKDKNEKQDVPPSPILMSSRANSVEIIKEDLTLTPKCQPRSVETDGSTAHDGAAKPSSGTTTPEKKSTNVSKTNEHVPPLPASEPPMVPDDNSLSSLLADISSLLTFDSISGGGDIIADVEAEWGKASKAFDAAVTNVNPSSFISTVSSPSASTTTKPIFSSAVTSPSTTLSTSTKSSLVSEKLNNKAELAPSTTTTKPSTTPVTMTNFPAAGSSSSSRTSQSTFAPTMTSPSTLPGSAPPSAGKLFADITPSASKTATLITSSPGSRTHSPAVAVTQPPPLKLDSVNCLNLQKSNSFKPSQSAPAEVPKAPDTISTTCTITTKPSTSTSIVSSRVTTVPTSATPSDSVFTALSKPSLSTTLSDSNKTPPTVSAPHLSSTSTTANKTQPSPAPAPVHSSAIDKSPPTIKASASPASADKASSPPRLIPETATHAATPQSLAPTARGQITACPSPASSAQITISKERAAPAQAEVAQSKAIPATAQVSDSLPRDFPASVKTQAAPLKESLTSIQTSVLSACRDSVAVATSSSKDPVAPTQSTSFPTKPPAGPAQISSSITKEPSASVSIPVSLPKTAPTSAQNTVSQPSTNLPPVSKPPSIPPPAAGTCEAPLPAKTKAVTEHQLTSPDGERSQAMLSKTKEPLHESPAEPPKEKKPTSVKASGLSKIPVVGGGRVGKIPVREQVNDEPRDPPTPIMEERPHFNSHDTASKDKGSTAEATTPTSKIPVKHGAQTKEAPRTKIPVSKVPVRRAGSKPAAVGGGGSQIRK